MTDVLTPDICVIGAGSGGLTMAAAAAAFGVPVILIERGKMGGDCLNHGCVPSKALLAAAGHAEAIRKASAFGIHAGEPQIDFAAVHAHVHGVIDAIAPNDSVERYQGLGVEVIKAEARFLDADTVEAGGRRIRARRFVIATGSSPLVPSIAGLEGVPYLTNETLFDLTARPEHLIIVGGGPIGLEMAQAHRRLGARVTVLEAGRAMGREDPELAAVALKRLRAEGVEICENTQVERVSGAAGAITVHAVWGDGRVEAISGTYLLLAAGRAPNVEDLGLRAAGIAYDAKGITVGRDMRTSNRRVYAIGDVAGGPQFTHAAGHQAGLVARALLFRLPARSDPDAMPRVTFTDPALGQAGLTESQARERGLAVTVLTWPFAENDRAQAERRTEGFIKLIVGRRGRLLGAGVVGAQAGEITNLFSLAVSRKMTVADLRDVVSPYPTFGEIGKRAATSYYRQYTERPILRRIVSLLQCFD